MRLHSSDLRDPRQQLLPGMLGGRIPLEVLLGGPGQGKSTVGRFLSLIHSAIILLTAPIDGLVPDAEVAHLNELLDGLTREGIPLPEVLQLPLWIELRELVDALLDDDTCELAPLRSFSAWFASSELRERDDAAALEAALNALPWVIVFDGLDEVPPERGRAIVRACIAAVRTSFAPGDRHVIGTSRPQSYERAVFGDDLVERTLRPLTPERATAYAERFAACLYDDQQGERARLLRRMKGALAHPTTAALMRSPLLVTIMAALVLHHGEPTDRRWTLFEDYYKALYRRETERGTFASKTLRDHAQVIDAIHMHVGMSLQARSEDARGVSALMPEDELRAILHARLAKGFGPEEAAQIAGEILRATEQRLVFLVQSRKGMYGFDLRSFQEFMAAWQVVSLPEAKTTTLLRQLAPKEAWRNVVLFAIGHQYAHNAALAEARSVGLCAALDDQGDLAARLVRPGARLALAVLEDAPYGKATVPRDALVAQALTLMEVPSEGVHGRLHHVLSRVAPVQVPEGIVAPQEPSPLAMEWLKGSVYVELISPRHGFQLRWFCGSCVPYTTTGALADALDAVAASFVPFSPRPLARPLPWPLEVIWVAAQDATELRATATRVRQGELGQPADWLRAEGGGPPARARQFRIEHLQQLAASPDPLSTILVDGLVLPFSSLISLSLDQGSLAASVLLALDRTRQAAAVPWVRRMLARIETQVLYATWVHDASEGGSSLAAAELLSLLEDTGGPLHLSWFVSLRELVAPDVFVDVIARSTAPLTTGSSSFRRAPLEGLFLALLRALVSAPGSARLQRALFLLLRSAPSLRGRIPPDLGPFGDTVDAWMLRFVTGRATAADLPTLATLLASIERSELRANLSLFATCAPSAPHIAPLIEALVALQSTSPTLRATAVDFLADRLARASSNLAHAQTWLDAGLPAPPPVRPLTEPPDAPGAHLTSFEVTNLRAFDATFKVTAPRPSGEGQWLVFLGENATGKTTLLRALALALAHPSDAAAIPSNLDGPLRRTPALDGVARVITRDGRTLTATVSSADGGERVTSAPDDALRPWVVAYGCRRGSATSGTDMDTAFVAFRDLDNLFDRPRGVVRASAWLKELQRRARNNGSRSKEVFEAARAALKETLLDAEDVLLDDEVTVSFPNGRTVPLNLLSDGYLTTAGWVADLMARWIKRGEDRRRPIGKDFCAEMEGVCLLDEVDLHLHPRWQERVIEDVRRLFPKMTFVATTHHPLTLRGARGGEVFVLGDHDGTGRVTALQRDIPAGTRVDELVTGAWFNRPSAIVDQGTRDLLARHQRLIVEGAKAGSPERKKVEAELRKRLGRYADTSLERLAATIVAQHLDASLPEPTAQEREAVRAEVLKVLARREARKK